MAGTQLGSAGYADQASYFARPGEAHRRYARMLDERRAGLRPGAVYDVYDSLRQPGFRKNLNQCCTWKAGYLPPA